MTNRDDAKLSEILIGKVCSYQCLYNPSNVSYKSTRHKKLCWMKIGIECNLDASVAKGKWKSLRDRYVRERKAEKIAERRGTTTPRKEWALYKYLSFLDPYLSLIDAGAEDGIKSERDSEDSSAAVAEDDCAAGHFLDMHSYSRPVRDDPPPPPPPAPAPQPFVYILPAPPPADKLAPPPSKKARSILINNASKDPAKKNASPLEKRFMKYVNQHGLEEAEEYSSDEMFVLSLVPSFNKLTEARKDKLKLDMHKLVYDAVYGST